MAAQMDPRRALIPPLDLHQPQEVSGIASSPDEVKEGQVDMLDGLTGDFERSEPAADPFGLPSHSEGIWGRSDAANFLRLVQIERGSNSG
jgi:hypothetical protein